MPYSSWHTGERASVIKRTKKCAISFFFNTSTHFFIPSIYKSLIFTITAAILSSVAYGMGCNPNQMNVCDTFCQTHTKKFGQVTCFKRKYNLACYNKLKGSNDETICDMDLAKECSEQYRKSFADCSCADGAKESCVLPPVDNSPALSPPSGEFAGLTYGDSDQLHGPLF